MLKFPHGKHRGLTGRHRNAQSTDPGKGQHHIDDEVATVLDRREATGLGAPLLWPEVGKERGRRKAEPPVRRSGSECHRRGDAGHRENSGSRARTEEAGPKAEDRYATRPGSGVRTRRGRAGLPVLRQSAAGNRGRAVQRVRPGSCAPGEDRPYT